MLEALRALGGRRRPIEVVSDSTYVVNCFRDRWYVRWETNGWRNAKKQPVANADLWKPLIELVAADDVHVPLGQGPQRRPPQRPRRPARRGRHPALTSARVAARIAQTWTGRTRQDGIARSRSATMSSPSSRPTEMRSRPGVMPIAACSSGVRLTWVLVAGVAHERLRAAERRGRAGDAQGVEHRPGGVDAAGEVDGEHRRQARQLARGQVVLRVVGQSGVVHGGDAGVVEPARRRGAARRRPGGAGARRACGCRAAR